MTNNELVTAIKRFQREPGLMSLDTISEVQKFYTKLETLLEIYNEAHNRNLVGGTIRAELQRTKFYLDRGDHHG